MNIILLFLAGAVLAGIAPPSFAADYPLCGAVKKNDIKAVRKLLKRGDSPNIVTKDCGAVLAFAAYSGQANMVKALLAGGANPNLARKSGITAGATALMFAARFGREESVKILLKNGARINHAAASGHTALSWAAARDELGAAEILLDGGANPNLPGTVPPLAAAAKEGHVYMIKLLQKRGAKLTFWQKAEATAGAVAAGKLDAAKTLWD